MTQVEKLQAKLKQARATIAQLRAGTCATHPHITLRCPACAGAKGGASKSPKKADAARRNIAVVNEPSTPSAKEIA